ncbi:MAG: hypothetical protein NTY46_07150 [Candidatus Sumerlaeota bacterium]|nr:hypothetical protein [Candidatus Sumerlaeota bacterium]
MTLGKREQIVFISIAALVAILVLHLLVFKPRADEYTDTNRKFQEGDELLKNAEVPPNEKFIPDFKAQTEKYDKELSGVLATLNIDLPPAYANDNPASSAKALEETTGLLRQLVDAGAAIKQPSLTFLNDKRNNPNDPYARQEGWNLPRQLPSGVSAAKAWETAEKLYHIMGIMERISDPYQKLAQRVQYNTVLRDIGINPPEVCDWGFIYGNQYIFFNDTELAGKLAGGQQASYGGQSNMGLQSLQTSIMTGNPAPVNGVFKNPFSTSRFGVMVPILKRLWMTELLWSAKPANPPLNTAEQLRKALEVSMPKDLSVLSVNRQLAALLDIIKQAQKNNVAEISQVNLMRPADIAKGIARGPGELPKPEETSGTDTAAADGSAPPAAAGPMMMPGMMMPGMMGPGGPGMGGFGPMGMMGMQAMQAQAAGPPPEEKIGTAAGLEIFFRATNPNMVSFLFDLSHKPRTYAIDDLEIQARPDGVNWTSTTIQLITRLEALK